MESLDAEALRRLFPDAFWEPFLEQGSRPDGRPCGQARPAGIGLGVVTHASSSALVKLGNTAVLAATRLEIVKPRRDALDSGILEVSFEMPPVCSPTVRPGWLEHDAHVISRTLQELLAGGTNVMLTRLCIQSGTAVWAVSVDVLCVDADGAVLDAALLASLAALMSLELPELRRAPDGRLVAPEQLGGSGGEDSMGVVSARRKADLLQRVPLAQTISLHARHLLVDPTGEEERLWGGSNTLTLVLDAASLGTDSPVLLSLLKAGGTARLPLATLHDCVAVAHLNAKEKHQALTEALQDAGGEEEGDDE